MRYQNHIRFQANDYYAYLNLDSSASTSDIKRNYRQLALQWHPDKQVSGTSRAEATDIFQKITDAHGTLTDSDQRRSYDYVWKQTFRGKQRIPFWARNAGRRSCSVDSSRALSCDRLSGRGASIERHARVPPVTQPRREHAREGQEVERQSAPSVPTASPVTRSLGERFSMQAGQDEVSSVPICVTRASFGKSGDQSFSNDEQNTDSSRRATTGMSEKDREAFKSHVAQLAKRKKREQEEERLEREAEEAWEAALERERQERIKEQLISSERMLQETLKEHLTQEAKDEAKDVRVGLEPRAKARSSSSMLQPGASPQSRSPVVGSEDSFGNAPSETEWDMPTGLTNIAGYAVSSVQSTFGAVLSPFFGSSSSDAT